MSEAPETDSAPDHPPRPGAELPVDPNSTVGTGSVFAIGCTLLVLIIILIGVGLFISRQVN